MKKPQLSIIYVYYNTPSEMIESLRSLQVSCRGLSYEVIIVDNNSENPLPRSVVQNRRVRVFKSKENRGFGAGVNFAARKTQGEFLLIVNPDTVFEKNAVKKMLSKLKADQRIGIVSPKIIDSDGKILDSISKMPFLPTSFLLFSSLRKIWPLTRVDDSYHLHERPRNKQMTVDVVSGACLMMRKQTFVEVSGFDERFFMYFEEADLSFRVRSLGLLLLFLPSAVVTHYVGRSTSDTTWIRRTFQKSRYAFYKKYHGILVAFVAESALRSLSLNTILLTNIILMSVFLNYYQLSSHMMFFGDFGRDLLAARDMLLTGRIPLVGIPSSVTWLHQGPLSIYFIGLSLLLSQFSPVGPAYFYAGLGVLTTFLVYVLGKMYFDRKIGLLSALFFATSPLVLVNVRIPYHTAPIPFFSAIFLMLLWFYLKERRFVFFLGLSLGLLLLLELSNAVLFFVLALLYVIFRTRIRRREFVKFVLGFILGASPFVLYDLSHRFIQSGGFILWIANRIRLFLGLTISGESTTKSLPAALATVFDEIRRFIYPQEQLIVLLVLFSLCFVVFSDVLKLGRKNVGLLLCAVWVLVSLLGFVVHAAPGSAYFPLLFVPFSLLFGFTWERLGKIWKPFTVFCSILIIANALYTIRYQYFLDSREVRGSQAPGWNYGLGETLSEQIDMTKFILKSADDREVILEGGGFLRKFPSSIDNFRYLVWYEGRSSIKKNGSVTYRLYRSFTEIPKDRRILYTNSFIYVTKK